MSRKRRAEAQLRQVRKVIAEGATGAPNQRSTLFDKLMANVVTCLRGKRVYTASLVERIAKIGTAPSAGSRSSIAKVATHTGDEFCDEVTGTCAR